MSHNERSEIVDLGVLGRSARFYLNTHPDVLWDNVKGAIFDTKGAFPDVDVVWPWCNMTIAECIWSAKVMHDALKGQEWNPTDGKVRRNVTQVQLDGANHFVSLNDLILKSTLTKTFLLDSLP